MFGLVIVAWTGFLAAGVSMVAFAMEREVSSLVVAFSTMATGFVFLALDHIVRHLEMIARTLATRKDDVPPVPSHVVSASAAGHYIEPTRPMEVTSHPVHAPTQPSLSARNALMSGRITQSKFGKFIVAGRQFDSLEDAEAHLNAQA